MARPAPDGRRDRILHIRLTSEELAAIEAAAKAGGVISVSVWARNILMSCVAITGEKGQSGNESGGHVNYGFAHQFLRFRYLSAVVWRGGLSLLGSR